MLSSRMKKYDLGPRSHLRPSFQMSGTFGGHTFRRDIRGHLRWPEGI